jgi:hypothetical protein
MDVPASYQTIALRPGRHRAPEDGACVMELASMLAGERFTDHPRSVCPIIAAFLRPYNDRIGAALRNDLYAIASAVVGTAGDRRLRRTRVARCRAQLLALEPHTRRCTLPRGGRALAATCAYAYVRHGRHAEALAFVADLAAMSQAPGAISSGLGVSTRGTPASPSSPPTASTQM